MAATIGAARRRCRTGLDLRRPDWLVGRRSAGGPRGEQLSERQDRAPARFVGRAVAPSLSFLLIHSLSEFVRGLGIADRGKPGAREVLCGFGSHIDSGSRRRPYRLFRSVGR